MNEHSFLSGQLAIPGSFCCLEWGSDFFEYSTKVLSVFSEGFVITSPRRLRTGSVLSVRIRVPSDRLDIAFWKADVSGLWYRSKNSRMEDSGIESRWKTHCPISFDARRHISEEASKAST